MPNKGTYSERFNTSESRSESDAQESGIIIDSKRTPADPTGRPHWSSETRSESSPHTKIKYIGLHKQNMLLFELSIVNPIYM